jgi:hypothetical protein
VSGNRIERAPLTQNHPVSNNNNNNNHTICPICDHVCVHKSHSNLNMTSNIM